MPTQLNQNTTDLQSILDAVNALPEAGYDKEWVDTATDDIATAITNKGVQVPDGTKLDGMAALIGEIETGGGIIVVYTTPTSGVTYTEGIADLDAETISLVSSLISNNTSITNMTTDVYIDFGENHYKASIGSQVTIALNGEDYLFDIIGFNHDNLTDATAYGFTTATGKAGITLLMHNLFSNSYQMNSSRTNSGGWKNSEMRTSTMATMKGYLPSAWQSIIKPVNKTSGIGGYSEDLETVSDSLFLLAEAEIFGADIMMTVYDEGFQYAYFAAGNSPIKNLKDYDAAYDWWGRSPAYGFSDQFFYVYRDGSPSASYANRRSFVAFAFCV